MKDDLRRMIVPRDPEGSPRTNDEMQWNTLIEYVLKLEDRLVVLEKRADDKDTLEMEASERE